VVIGLKMTYNPDDTKIQCSLLSGWRGVYGTQSSGGMEDDHDES